MVNLAQILTLDKSRLQRRLGTVSPDRMAKVEDAIRVSLDVQ
jgi:mRNA-degrading endonuclease toxin of MazEF toxin-antitoxin module